MKRRILSVVLTAMLLLSVVPVNLAFANALGDINGDGNVTAADARLALRASVNLETFDEVKTAAADVNFDGKIQATDARLILRASVGLEELADPHTHSYSEKITTQPTCTEKGVKTFTCECGDSYTEDIPATGHSYEETVTQATCTEKGVKTFTCKCGDSYTEDIPATGHDYKAVVTEPTCTKGGYTTYTCDVCSDSYTDNETPAKGHTVVVDAAVAPTCGEAGKTEGSHCSVCNEILVAQEEIPATGEHTSVLDESTVKAVTCTENGYTGDEKCSVCGITTKEGTVITSEGTEHIFENTTVLATCTTDGYTVDKCKFCEITDNDTYELNENDLAKGHVFGEPEVIAPTCTEEGYTLKTCTVCEADEKYDFVDAEGHSYTWETTTEATCEHTGSRTGTCSVCGDVTTEEIGITPCTPCETPETIHGNEDVLCKQVIKCTVCGKILAEEENKAAHSIKKPVPGSQVIATCTTDGTVVKECEYCNYTVTTVTHTAKGHQTPGAVYEAPSCEEGGHFEFSGLCTVCGQNLETTIIEIPAKGHTLSGVQSCTTAVVCTDCGEIVEPALGHSYEIHSAAYNTKINTFFCTRCGEQTNNSLDAFNNIANKIIDYDFYNNYCTQPNRIQYIEKTHIETAYSRFDFGIYTSAIRSLYEDEMANTPDEYTPVIKSSITARLPLAADRGYVSLLTKDDINSINVEKLSGISINDILSGYPTTYSVGSTQYDLSKFKNVNVTDDVIKVTIDVKNEKYSQVKNLDEDTLTALQKIYNMDIREEIRGYDTDANGNLIMEEVDKGDGYEISMKMKLTEIESDARVTYYFDADTYEPIIALYDTDVKMDQTIEMKFKIGIFSLNGALDPIIETNYTRAYLFPNYFELY